MNATRKPLDVSRTNELKTLPDGRLVILRDDPSTLWQNARSLRIQVGQQLMFTAEYVYDKHAARVIEALSAIDWERE